MRNEKEYHGKGVKAELGAYGASLWKKYLRFYRRNRIRGIGTVGLCLILPVSMVLAFKRSRINYIEVVSSWFKSSQSEADVTDVSSEEPESGFNVIVKFTYGTICSEPNFKKKVQNTVTKGQKFEVLETSGDFYRIEYLQNRFGWIDKYFVEKEGQEEPKVEDPHNPVEIKGETATALKRICQDYSAMGVGVAVIKDGKVSYTYSYGYANKAQRKKINSDTKFRPASLSKIISTLSTMTLVVNEQAYSMASTRSSLLCAGRIPTLEPELAGFTITGYESFFSMDSITESLSAYQLLSLNQA